MFEKSLMDYLNDGYVQGLNKSVFSPPKPPVGEGGGGAAAASPGPQIPKPPPQPDYDMGNATMPGTPMKNPGGAQGISALLAPAGQVAGQWGSKAMVDYLKSPGQLSPEMTGLMGNFAGPDTQSGMIGALGKEMLDGPGLAEGIPELGGFQKYLGNPMMDVSAPGGFDMMASAPDPMSIAGQAPGMIMKGLNIGSPTMQKGVSTAGKLGAAALAAPATGGLSFVPAIASSLADWLMGGY